MARDQDGERENSDPSRNPLMSYAENAAGTVRNPMILLKAPLFWEQGAAGSNPAAPTNGINGLLDTNVPQKNIAERQRTSCRAFDALGGRYVSPIPGRLAGSRFERLWK